MSNKSCTVVNEERWINVWCCLSFMSMIHNEKNDVTGLMLNFTACSYQTQRKYCCKFDRKIICLFSYFHILSIQFYFNTTALTQTAKRKKMIRDNKQQRQKQRQQQTEKRSNKLTAAAAAAGAQHKEKQTYNSIHLWCQSLGCRWKTRPVQCAKATWETWRKINVYTEFTERKFLNISC